MSAPDAQSTLTEQHFSPKAKNKQLMTNRTPRNIKSIKHNKKQTSQKATINKRDSFFCTRERQTYIKTSNRLPLKLPVYQRQAILKRGLQRGRRHS
jgi:hypothetical protein